MRFFIITGEYAAEIKKCKDMGSRKKKGVFIQRIKKKKGPEGKTVCLESKEPTLKQEDESDGFSQTQ